MLGIKINVDLMDHLLSLKISQTNIWFSEAKVER